MIVVVAEHHLGRVTPASLEAIAAAGTMGRDVHVVVVSDDGTIAAALASVAIAGIVCLRHAELADYTPDAFIAALAAWLPTVPVTHVVFPHSYQARDYAPRLAARLGRTLLADCTGVVRQDDRFVFRRLMFHRRLVADVVLDGPFPHFVSFQAGAGRADALPHAAAPCPVQVIEADIGTVARRQVPEPPFRETGDAVDLTRAERIVAVGRGVKDVSHLSLVERLAAALGADMAASRPVCDAGLLPMDRQIGSSGQTVSPRLYVAVGISGAVQHVVGMKTAGTIVAINKDPEAPIFDVADYGIVGDLAEVVPAIADALERS